MAEHDLTKGNIRRQLWVLAWPMMLTMFFHTLYNLVDTYWVSKLSAESIAAVSISQVALFVMISLGFGITIGSGVIMSMHIGAKNRDEAERVLAQSFVLASLAGVLFSGIALLFRTTILIASGAQGAIFAPALTYFTITSAGSILFFLMVTVMFAFNAQGDTFTLTKLFALSTVINVVLDPILIFGKFGFPSLGIAGAAIATLISQAIFLIAAIISLSRPQRSIRFAFRNLSVQWASVKEVLRIGIPASLTQVITPLGLASLSYIISRGFGEAGAIAFSLGFRVEFFAFLPAAGFGFASMAIIGQSIGAKKISRAKETFQLSLISGVIGSGIVGILSALFATPLIKLFTTDPQVIVYARSYFLSAGLLSYGFLAAMMIEASVFQSVGRSWPGFWIFITRFAVVSIPLSILVLVLQLPIIGIWIAIMLGNIAAAIFGYFWAKRMINSL